MKVEDRWFWWLAVGFVTAVGGLLGNLQKDREQLQRVSGLRWWLYIVGRSVAMGIVTMAGPGVAILMFLQWLETKSAAIDDPVADDAQEEDGW